MAINFYISILCVLIFAVSLSMEEMEDGVSYVVKAGVKDCFYRELKIDDRMDFEVQVLSGGDVDITTVVKSPSNVEILKIERAPEVSEELLIKENGVYEICFDNTFSIVSEKVVYFDLGVDHYNKSSLDHSELFEGLNLEKDTREDVKEISKTLDNIGMQFETIQNIQAIFRWRYKRHAYLQDSNLHLVTWFSSASCLLMVVVGFLQVYLIRNFFNEKTTRGMQSRL